MQMDYDQQNFEFYGGTALAASFPSQEKGGKLDPIALSNGIHRFPDGLLFRDLLRLWLQDNRVRTKASTAYRYQYLIDTHIAPELGNDRLSQLAAPRINAYLAEKLHQGRRDQSGGLSASYVRSIALVISSSLKFGAEQGLCPYIYSQINKPSIPRKDIPILSRTQQEKLETVLTGDLDGTKLGVYISLYTGLRIGEVCALGWNDVDLSARILHVRGTVARIPQKSGGKGRTLLAIDTPKTSASFRSIPICSSLLAVLEACAARSTSNYVISSDTDFVSPRTFDYRFKKLLAQAQIPQFNYHALRHTFATRCIESGMDVKTLSELLGHSNAAITLNTYVHPSMDLKRRQLERIVVLRGK